MPKKFCISQYLRCIKNVIFEMLNITKITRFNLNVLFKIKLQIQKNYKHCIICLNKFTSLKFLQVLKPYIYLKKNNKTQMNPFCYFYKQHIYFSWNFTVIKKGISCEKSVSNNKQSSISFKEINHEEKKKLFIYLSFYFITRNTFYSEFWEINENILKRLIRLVP